MNANTIISHLKLIGPFGFLSRFELGKSLKSGQRWRIYPMSDSEDVLINSQIVSKMPLNVSSHQVSNWNLRELLVITNPKK